MVRVRCNMCEAEFDEKEIIYDGELDMEFCPKCGECGCLMDLDDINEVRRAKHRFVKERLSPLLRAIDANIQEARYQIGATLEEVSYQHTPSPISEYVIIVYKNGHMKGVDVSANSHLSICRDVLKALN